MRRVRVNTGHKVKFEHTTELEKLEDHAARRKSISLREANQIGAIFSVNPSEQWREGEPFENFKVDCLRPENVRPKCG